MNAHWREPRDEDERRAMFNGARSAALSHPRFFPDSSGKQRPSVRLGLRVACGALSSSHPPTSDIRRAFVHTLGSGLLDAVVSDLTPTTGRRWVPYDSSGRLSFGAVLAANEDDPAPSAWARFSPPYLDFPMAGRDPRCADLVVYMEMGDGRGGAAESKNLPRWLRRFADYLDALATVPGQLLAGELGLTVAQEPAMKAAVWLNSDPDLTTLVDTTGIRRLAGSTTSNYFGAYAVADPSGLPAARFTTEWIRQLCDDALRLDDYESILITSAP